MKNAVGHQNGPIEHGKLPSIHSSHSSSSFLNYLCSKISDMDRFKLNNISS